jgi:tRNA(Ile)-lysidine synthase
MPLLDRIVETIARYGMFARGQRVGVAVSGGADSVCLLHALRELQARWNLSLSVLHVDHGLRGAESRGDAEFVRELAGRLGLDFYVHEAVIGGDNLEQAARQARRKFFLEYLRRGVADRIALGHTRSDQAETVLFRFLRGSGTTGLAAIRPVTSDGFVRPLIEVDRAEVLAYLKERGLAWREDSSNQDRAFARNRIRHDLLPLLAAENPALNETLAQTALLAQEDEDYWNWQIDRLARTHMGAESEDGPGAVLLRADWLAKLPKAAARRLIRRAVERAKGDLRGIDFAHIAQVLALTDTTEGHGRVQIPGLDVFRSFEWLRLAPPGEPGRNFRLPAPVPGKISLPGSEFAVILEVVEGVKSNSGYNSDWNILDWERIPGPLEFRNWRPGDQYCPAGHTSEEKIKSLFQRARIPLWERRRWPILAGRDDVIVWTRRFGAADRYRATPGSRKILKIQEIEDPAKC